MGGSPIYVESDESLPTSDSACLPRFADRQSFAHFRQSDENENRALQETLCR